LYKRYTELVFGWPLAKIQEWSKYWETAHSIKDSANWGYVIHTPPDGFDIEFELTAPLSQLPEGGGTAGTGNITIYNYPYGQFAGLEVDSPVLVKSGYRNFFDSIFLGKITEVKSKWEGPTEITEITVSDGTEYWKTYPVNVKSKASIRWSDLIKQTLDAIRCPYHLIEQTVYFIPQVERGIYSYCYSGNLFGFLEDVNAHNHNEFRYYFHHGALMWVTKHFGYTTGYIFDWDRGLLYIEPIGDAKVTRDWKAKFVMYPHIDNNSVLKIPIEKPYNLKDQVFKVTATKYLSTREHHCIEANLKSVDYVEEDIIKLWGMV